MILRNVEVRGRIVDVLVAEGRVAAMAERLTVPPGVDVLDGGGGALLPGLHDHHLHLLAMAAARASVDCSSGLEPLRESASTGWIRGFGFTGNVDRHALDAVVRDQPVRVQHRSGALWMLNSAALALVALDDSSDVERGADGSPTGRLWRYDERLRRSLANSPPSLEPVVEELFDLGITSVTDATPELDPEAVRWLGELAVDVTMLGDPAGPGPWKIVLGDHDLPSYGRLAAQVARARGRGQAVAVHCVTREALLLALGVLEDEGRVPGDRIEHAAVVPDPSLLRGLRVVTQPAFIAHRGDEYLANVDARDVAGLYPWRSIQAEGADVLPSSDAPFGPLDPWMVMRSARDRLTPSGEVLGSQERVQVRTALDGYLRDANGAPRRVEVGGRARLVLLHAPLSEALADPVKDLVRSVWR